MHVLKKLVLLLLLIFAGHYGFAQECPEDFITILEDDDTAALAEVITPANINECCEQGYTMLSHAIRNDAPLCIDWLLQKGADVSKRCGGSKPPLYMACKYGDLAMFKKLVAKGADITAHYGDGLQAYAVKYNKPDIVEYIKTLKK